MVTRKKKIFGLGKAKDVYLVVGKSKRLTEKKYSRFVNAGEAGKTIIFDLVRVRKLVKK